MTGWAISCSHELGRIEFSLDLEHLLFDIISEVDSRNPINVRLHGRSVFEEEADTRNAQTTDEPSSLEDRVWPSLVDAWGRPVRY